MLKKNSSLFLFGTISLIFITIVLLVTFITFKDSDPTIRGTFGDMFGGANALFTGFSFVGLLITILLQREDIKYQKDEMKSQSFENTFFNLVNINRETVGNLHVNRTRRTSTATGRTETDISSHGSAVFTYIYGRYIDCLPDNKKFDNDVYLRIYKENWAVLGHYFRSLEIILLTIENLETNYHIDHNYKQRFMDIIKAQLSEYETAIIFYHFLSSKGIKFKIIAEKYNLFEFVNDELVTDDKIFYVNKSNNKL